MTKVGIDKIGFATSGLYIDMAELAGSRGIDPEKFTLGIGQVEQSVVPSSQDCVTLAAQAAKDALEGEGVGELDMVLVGTESGVDASKASAIYVKELLSLPDRIRCVEVKQACYSATAALFWALDYVYRRPGKKVLVIGSDVARYGLNTPGEATQGGGAVALLVSANPKILEVEGDPVTLSGDVADFWRPNYSNCAIVNGKYSVEVYMEFFAKLWERYKKEAGRAIADFGALLFHLPFSKMGMKALRSVLPEADEGLKKGLLERFEASCYYSKRVGNIYSGSLYMSLMSLLELSPMEAGSRIGLFSYGSGAEADFFAARLQDGYRSALRPERHLKMLEERKRVGVREYEHVFSDFPPSNSQDWSCEERYVAGPFSLLGIRGQKRIYEARG